MGKLITVLGGVRSGKSRHAVTLAQRAGTDVAYIATCLPQDDEMRQRVARHQAHRPAHWITIEERWDLAVVLEELSGRVHAAIIDDLTLWVSARLEQGAPAREVIGEAEAMGRAVHDVAQDVVVVTHEVGSGIIPVTPLGRQFVDVLGEANQAVARASDEVFVLTAGIPQKIK